MCSYFLSGFICIMQVKMAVMFVSSTMCPNSNVINSIMLWCIIMLMQLCSYCACSYSFNLSVKDIVD